MANPILPGYNFKIEHVIKKSNYSMPCMDEYTDYHSFGYMLSGDRIIITPPKTVYVHPDTIVFIHKNLPHRTTFASNVDYENFSIKFRPDILQNFEKNIGQSVLDDLFNQITVRVTPEANKKIKSLLSEIEKEWNVYSNYSNFMIECLFNEILIIISANQIDESSLETSLSEKHEILFDAIHYLEQNFQYDPSLAATASKIHVSSSYLSRLFTFELGSSYSDFLLHMKLAHAQRLLINTSFSISDIAALSGFNNNCYFSDIFKRINGVSPLKFRKNYTSESS